MPDEITNMFDMNASDISAINFDKLVQLRFKHQTKQAATGVRKKTHTERVRAPSSDDESTGGKRKEETERQSLMRRFHEVIKEQQDRGTGTGVERGLRWGLTPAAGNAANAAESAAARSTRASQFFITPRLDSNILILNRA